MARTCVWCGDPLPEPKSPGHRRREFCARPKNCRQQHYLWHQQMRRDAERIADPYWRRAYTVLVERYKFLEKLMQDRLNDLGKAQERIERLQRLLEYYKEDAKALQADYEARLKTLGLSDKDIEEFHTYWQELLKRIEEEERWARIVGTDT